MKSLFSYREQWKIIGFQSKHNLNFLPWQKYFNKKKCCNKINYFYQRIKHKANFKDKTSKPKTEEDRFRKPTDKVWVPPKKKKQQQHIIELFTETTSNQINLEIADIKPSKYENLSKEEQKALEDM